MVFARPCRRCYDTGRARHRSVHAGITTHCHAVRVLRPLFMWVCVCVCVRISCFFCILIRAGRVNWIDCNRSSKPMLVDALPTHFNVRPFIHRSAVTGSLRKKAALLFFPPFLLYLSTETLLQFITGTAPPPLLRQKRYFCILRASICFFFSLLPCHNKVE